MFIRMNYSILLIGLIFIAGCGGVNTRYAWNNYDVELYDHYKNPAQKEEFILAMKEIIESAESKNKVPPGIYAEYGYLMYEKGDIAKAVLFYQKEADMWPESKFLMAKMIANTQKRSDNKENDPKAVTNKLPVEDITPTSADATAPPTALSMQKTTRPATAEVSSPTKGSKSGPVISASQNSSQKELDTVEVLK